MIGGALERLDGGGEVVDGVGDGQVGDDLGVGPQSLDLDVEARVTGGQHGVALCLVVGDPVLPAAGGHPQAVHEHDGLAVVVVHGGVLFRVVRRR